MNYLIEEQSQLKELEPLFDELIRNKGVVAVDTEFFREKTYSAKLCLVQLGIGENQYCIDVIAIEDLSSLSALFANTNVLKLFHAARQDMEVLYQTFNRLPTPIFDTQLAAAFNGADMQIGYAGLVKLYLDIELPKSQARTDWTRRPLSKVQLDYAADDVAYLLELYQMSLERLNASNKLQWFEEEIQTYYDVEKYVIEPDKAYKRLGGGGLNITQQYTLKALAGWREQRAQKRDIPRTWILRDDALFDLAIKQPKTEQEVRELNVFGKKSVNYLAQQAVEIIQNVEVGDARIWSRVEPLDKQDKGMCSKMMKHMAVLAERHSMAQGLLGTRKDIEGIYRNKDSDKLMHGWRKSIVGEPLLEFLNK